MSLREIRAARIPLPEPVFMIDVTHGTDRQKRVRVAELRFVAWAVPSLAVECALIFHGHFERSWLPLAAALLTLASCVLLVNAQPVSGEDES